MSSQLAASVPASAAFRPRGRRLARIALIAVGALGILAASHRLVQAQTTPEQKPGWGFLVTSGTVVPTGAQRDVVKRGNVTAAQLSYGVRPAVALTATFGWARSRDVASVDEPKLDIFLYDLGAEFRAPRLGSGFVSFRPFAGAGAGARSYNYRSLEVDATHIVAAYGGAGGELGVGPVRLRVEARDYVTRFKPLDGRGAANTRNDVVVMAGLLFGR
jgi:hypothetical protein